MTTDVCATGSVERVVRPLDCPLLALFGYGAMSSASPECAAIRQRDGGKIANEVRRRLVDSIAAK
jgi:hypothetical protein